MDPLSMAASVAGLIGLTLKVSRTIGSYCKSVKNAPKDMQQIAQELASMQDTLGQLDELLRSQQLKAKYFNQSSVLATALTVCSDSTKRILSKMQTLEVGGLDRVWEKLKWPFNEKEMQKTFDTLRRCAATFQFALTVEGCILLSRCSEDATKSLELQMETATKVLELTQDIGTMAESAKEALKISGQVSEILRLCSDYSTTVHAVQSLSHGVQSLAMRSQETRETEILSWLSSHKQARIHHDIRAKRIAGTGLWFLEHIQFHAWMSQLHSILWCSGNPGAGKSVLTSLVIDHILEKYVSPSNAIIYFYFDYRDQQVQTPAYFLASLLRQLVARTTPLPQPILDFYDHFKEEQPQDLMPELCRVFQETCEAYERCFIVIDALDECKHQNHRKEIIRVLKGLPTARISLFVTSRPHHHDIRQYFEDTLRIDVEASETDIKQYCSHMIEESPNITDVMSDSLRQQVIDTIANKAHGMFLLPVLQLQSVLEAMTKSEVKASLSNLSANLGQAFEKTIRRIENETLNRRQVAVQALSWVSHARRPLKIAELCHALATNIGDTALDQDNLLPPRLIIESCFGLVVLDEEGLTFRLVHYTLQDYLKSRQPQSYIKEETYITRVLITYLCFDEATDSSPKESSDEHRVPDADHDLPMHASLRGYAVANWGHHAKLSQPSEINDLALVLLTDVAKLIRTGQSLARCLAHGSGQLRYREPWDSRYRSLKTGLHVAAGFGLVELSKLLLDRGIDDIDARDSYKNTALHDAVIHRQSDTLTLLLERGAKANVRNIDDNTPLYLAVSYSYEELVSTLLMRGADLGYHCNDGWLPLHKAADNGHLAIAQKLLDHGASVTAKSVRGLIPLHRAAGRGHTQVVQLLLNRRSPVDMVTLDGWTPLHGASSSGQDDTVRVLLEHNAEVDRRSRDKRTALHRSCRGGYYDVVSRLLLANADPSLKDVDANFPLHRAAKGGHEKICNLLLQQASVSPLTQLSALNVIGRKPEKEASCSGHWKLSAFLRHEELLQRGMDVEERGDLEMAIEEGDLYRVSELLSDGADVNQIYSDSSAPLHQALLLRRESIARLLLQHDADVTLATADGWQPLHCAASQGMADMVSLCLERSSAIDARTLDGHTALHKCCRGGNLKTAQILVDSGADIEAQDDWGWRALHCAAAAGFQDIVEFLLTHNADRKARDNESRTAQACAAMAGQHALVEYLRQIRPRAEYHLPRRYM